MVMYFWTLAGALSWLLAFLVMFTKCVAKLSVLSLVTPVRFFFTILKIFISTHIINTSQHKWAFIWIKNYEVIVKSFRQNDKLMAEEIYDIWNAFIRCIHGTIILHVTGIFARSHSWKINKMSFMKMLKSSNLKQNFLEQQQVLFPIHRKKNLFYKAELYLWGSFSYNLLNCYVNHRYVLYFASSSSSLRLPKALNKSINITPTFGPHDVWSVYFWSIYLDFPRFDHP